MNLGHGLRVLLAEDKEQNREISVFNDLISYREKDIGKWRKTVRPLNISKNTAM